MKQETIGEQFVQPSWHWLWALAPIAFLLILRPANIPLDDGYITLHNARVLLSGTTDPVYGSSYMAGATSPIHLLLVAFFSSVMEPVWGSILISLYGAALYLWGISRIADRAEVAGWRKVVIMVLAATAGEASWLYVNGLETTLGMAATAWMLVWCDDKRKLPALAGLAPFIRPELGLLSVLLLARLAVRMDWRERYIAAGVTLAFAAPWAIWCLIEVGRFIPSTIGAKLAFYRPPPLSLLTRVLVTFFAFLHQNQLPFLFGLLGLFKIPAGKVAGMFVLIGMAAAFIIMPDIASWNGGRYTAIYFPVFIAGFVAMATERTKVSDAIICALAIWSVSSTIKPTARIWTTETHMGLEEHARFVATLPASSVVLIHDAGQVAWGAPKAKLVDVVGLKTPEAVAIHEKLTPVGCQRGKALDYLARQHGATHLVVLNTRPWPCVAENMLDEGWKLRPIYSKIYTVYEISAPSALD